MKCLGLLLLALVGHVYGQDDPFLNGFCNDVCENLPNGGYFPYPGDCCRYINCQPVNKRGDYFIGYDQTCMYPLVWNPVQHACDYDFRVDNCDMSCHGAFVPEITTPAVVTDPDTECIRGNVLYTSYSDAPRVYYVNGVMVNNTFGKNFCPPDFVFDLDECRCTGYRAPMECDCIMCIPFELLRAIDIVNRHYLEIVGMYISNYFNPAISGFTGGNQGCFAGNVHDSYLFMPVFANMLYGHQVSFNLWFQPQNDALTAGDFLALPPGEKQCLMSNGGCNETGSIYVWLEGSYAFFQFCTESGCVDDTIKYDNTSTYPILIDGHYEITFTYDDPNLKVCIGGLECTSYVLGGKVLTTPYGMTYGRCDDVKGTSFLGCMDNISFCRDPWSDEQIDELSKYNETAVMCMAQEGDFMEGSATILPETPPDLPGDAPALPPGAPPLPP